MISYIFINVTYSIECNCYQSQRYASEAWTWNVAQQSRICAVEMSYIRGACGVSGWNGESNENMYEQFGMGVTAKGVDCRVVEWMKRDKL